MDRKSRLLRHGLRLHLVRQLRRSQPYRPLSPTTLTTDEQRLILRATTSNVRDHTIISLALGTGLRLGEIVGLDVGDVFSPDGSPRVRVRIRKETAKGGRAADVHTTVLRG